MLNNTSVGKITVNYSDKSGILGANFEQVCKKLGECSGKMGILKGFYKGLIIKTLFDESIIFNV